MKSITKNIGKANNISLSGSKFVFLNTLISFSALILSIYLSLKLELTINPIKIIIGQQAILGFFQTFISLNYFVDIDLKNKNFQLATNRIIVENLLLIILFLFIPSLSILLSAVKLGILMNIVIMEGYSRKIAIVNFLISLSALFEVILSSFFNLSGLSIFIATLVSIFLLEKEYNLKTSTLINIINFSMRKQIKKFTFISIFYSLISSLNILSPFIIGLPIVESQLVSLFDRFTFFIQRVLQSSVTYKADVKNIKDRSLRINITNFLFYLSFSPVIFTMTLIILKKDFISTILISLIILICGFLRLEFTYMEYLYNNKRISIQKSHKKTTKNKDTYDFIINIIFFIIPIIFINLLFNNFSLNSYIKLLSIWLVGFRISQESLNAFKISKKVNF